MCQFSLTIRTKSALDAKKLFNRKKERTLNLIKLDASKTLFNYNNIENSLKKKL